MFTGHKNWNCYVASIDIGCAGCTWLCDATHSHMEGYFTLKIYGPRTRSEEQRQFPEIKTWWPRFKTFLRFTTDWIRHLYSILFMYFTFSRSPVLAARSDQFVFNEWQSKLVVEAHLCWSRLQPHYSHPHYSFYMKHEVWALPVHMRWWMIYVRDYCVQILFTLGTRHMEFTRSSGATDETQHQRPPMALFSTFYPRVECSSM